MAAIKNIQMKNVEAENIYNLFIKLTTEQHREEFKNWFISQLLNAKNYKENTYYYHDRDNGLNLTINVTDEGQPDIVFFSLDWVSPVDKDELQEANIILANLFLR